jgi:hypothetical protein
MLAFDLETTGLDPHTDRVTCAAAYDPDAGIDRAFLFQCGDDPEEFMALLDAADRLCAFNGARFDIPFLQHSLGASAGRALGWRMKLHDVYEGVRLALCVTFPLRALLAINGLEGKTGTGGDAVVMAREGRWKELADYCSHDTRMTHRVSSLERILLPKTHGIFMDSAGCFGQC